jgi:hypothetical protein
MTPRKLLKNPKTMIRTGLVCLLLFNIWPRFLHLTFNLGPDWIDGLRGVLLGLAMGLILLAAKLKRHQSCGEC